MITKKILIRLNNFRSFKKYSINYRSLSNDIWVSIIKKLLNTLNTTSVTCRMKI